MLLPCITIMVILSVWVEANVTPKLGIGSRLQGLETEEKSQVLKLEIYQAAGKDVEDLGRWFCMTAGLASPSSDDALGKLKNESCNEELHSSPHLTVGLINMCEAYAEANMNVMNCPKKLHRAECMAIYMYTSEFYTTYNPNVRKGHWEPYKVFTAILFSAIDKLDKANPLPNNTILYRGMDKKFDTDSKGRFYFKQFVSTTLDQEMAEMFGTGTIIVILPNVPIIAARLKELSKYPGEEEVLISPFEAFEFVNKTDNKLYFKSSRSQDFIDNADLKCQNPLELTTQHTFKIKYKPQPANSIGSIVSGTLHGTVLVALLASCF